MHGQWQFSCSDNFSKQKGHLLNWHRLDLLQDQESLSREHDQHWGRRRLIRTHLRVSKAESTGWGQGQSSASFDHMVGMAPRSPHTRWSTLDQVLWLLISVNTEQKTCTFLSLIPNKFRNLVPRVSTAKEDDFIVLLSTCSTCVPLSDTFSCSPISAESPETSVAFARANPPPRRSTRAQGIRSWTFCQVRRDGEGEEGESEWRKDMTMTCTTGVRNTFKIRPTAFERPEVELWRNDEQEENNDHPCGGVVNGHFTLLDERVLAVGLVVEAVGVCLDVGILPKTKKKPPTIVGTFSAEIYWCGLRVGWKC